MDRKQAKRAADAAIAKARNSKAPAGYWCESFDRRGRLIRMFVPATAA